MTKNLLRGFTHLETMNISTVNQIFFPVVLFILILSSFYIDSSLFAGSASIDERSICDRHEICELEKFFDMVSQNSTLNSQLDLIMEEDNFIEKIVILGNSLDYAFVAEDVRESIAEHTANPNSSYVCLPLGCWQVS